MTEAEWLASTDLVAMFNLLWWPRSSSTPETRNRKLRLFTCACVRRIWHQLTDPRSRQAIEVAERFADGVASGPQRVGRKGRRSWAATVLPGRPPLAPCGQGCYRRAGTIRERLKRPPTCGVTACLQTREHRTAWLIPSLAC